MSIIFHNEIFEYFYFNQILMFKFKLVTESSRKFLKFSSIKYNFFLFEIKRSSSNFHQSNTISSCLRSREAHQIFINQIQFLLV